MFVFFRIIIWLVYTFFVLRELFPASMTNIGGNLMGMLPGKGSGFDYNYSMGGAMLIKYAPKVFLIVTWILLGCWVFIPCSPGINNDCPSTSERYEQSGPIKLSKKEKFNKLKEFYIERADTPAAEADDDTKALQAGLQSLIADVEEQAKGYQSQITALASNVTSSNIFYDIEVSCFVF